MKGKPIKTCGAKTRAGHPCGKSRGWGTDHLGTGNCKLHGGASPNGRKYAAKEQAAEAVQKYGLPREIDPKDALVEELHRTAGWVAFLNEQVQSLTKVDEIRTLVGGGKGAIPKEVPHLWVQMLDREREHLMAIAKTCIEVGIEERRVKLAEEQGALMAQVIRGLLADLGVDVTEEVKTVVRRHLTLVA